MQTISRRAWSKKIALAALASSVYPFSNPSASAELQPVPTSDETNLLADIASRTMLKYNMPALSVAFAMKGQLVYQEAFGLANRAARERATPKSLFRIASLSKPITSVCIFTLIDQKRLHLDDEVFGARGILKFDFGQNFPPGVEKITLHHLLTHTSGWGGGPDPMGYQPQWNHQKLITWALHELPFKYEPGTHYEYLNFGYCVLGRVIEKVTGQSYAEYAKEAVLEKCGISILIKASLPPA